MRHIRITGIPTEVGRVAARDTTRLQSEGGLDWAALAGYFDRRAIPGVERVEGALYRRTVVVDGVPGVIELAPAGPDHLLLRTDRLGPADRDGLTQRARRIASLDLDLDQPRNLLAADAVLGPLVAARPDLRPPGTWDPFETGVRAILGQQVSVAGATTLAGRLVERTGTPMPERTGLPVPELAGLGLTRTFPSPDTLAGADLGGLGLTGARQNAIRNFAAAVAVADVRLDRSVTLDELVASIVALPGLGPWTAQYIALRLGEPDAFPATDLGVRKALAEHAPGARAEAVAERWRPWRSLATTHLWAALVG